jgi:hypothetical protein
MTRSTTHTPTRKSNGGILFYSCSLSVIGGGLVGFWDGGEARGRFLVDDARNHTNLRRRFDANQ